MATNRWRFVIEVADQGWVVRGFVGIIAVPSTAGRWGEDRKGSFGRAAQRRPGGGRHRQ